ncbi:hypothetical protein [Phytohabitans houttuyneae]|uniref:hypothetical protein n=1 Tax=Phytohabitans houttuyneae TaxID=1076126 RepID=UPI0015661BD3|nr:hypothetical protein [Phytohabitans houttuyneae]
MTAPLLIASSRIRRTGEGTNNPSTVATACCQASSPATIRPFGRTNTALDNTGRSSNRNTCH